MSLWTDEPVLISGLGSTTSAVVLALTATKVVGRPLEWTELTGIVALAVGLWSVVARAKVQPKDTTTPAQRIATALEAEVVPPTPRDPSVITTKKDKI